ncbi:RHOMBOID-like protein 1 [Cornus florida]|uniref:RHOMBOID-like protein 1 n=1 Tax=Cornus florida TaxID=4283 RepID=UPI0028A1F085|nr:RHOMBOID-like protein 1 [Cornus florida]
MGRDHSPELEIKVRPRRSEYESARPPSGSRHSQKPQQLFRQWDPWLVPTFTVVNIVLFIVTIYINDCPHHSGSCFGEEFLGRMSFQPLKENPLLGPSATTLQLMGALDVKKVIDDKQAWRLFTCMWLHAGVLHIVTNMFSLLFVGIRLEKEFGFGRIGILYIVSGMGGSLLSALLVRATISVGASGALFGLLGAMLSELITNWTIYANKLAALFSLILIIAINLAVGILPHVDNSAHVGGLVTGFFVGFVFFIRPQFGWVNQKSGPRNNIGSSIKSKYKTYQVVLLVLSLILLITGFAGGLVSLLRGVDGNDYCSWCHYLSCIPTSKWKCHSQKVYCESNLIGKDLSLTCLSNGKKKSYTLTDSSHTSEMEQFCSELCSS